MRRFALLFAFVSLLFTTIGLPSAQGALLTLSTYASNDGPAIDPDLLDATLDFFVVDTTLTLAVTNLTPEDSVDPPSLKINEIYFNALSNVTDLTLTAVEGSVITQWALGFLQGGGDDGDGNPYQVNNFGKFDVYLTDGEDNQPYVIDPGETVTFFFDITGTGPFSDTDFIELSTQVNEHIQSYAAAKFYNGTDISAYGAVPEPATILLLSLGTLALLRRRRL